MFVFITESLSRIHPSETTTAFDVLEKSHEEGMIIVVYKNLRVFSYFHVHSFSGLVMIISIEEKIKK